MYDVKTELRTTSTIMVVITLGRFDATKISCFPRKKNVLDFVVYTGFEFLVCSWYQLVSVAKIYYSSIQIPRWLVIVEHIPANLL